MSLLGENLPYSKVLRKYFTKNMGYKKKITLFGYIALLIFTNKSFVKPKIQFLKNTYMSKK